MYFKTLGEAKMQNEENRRDESHFNTVSKPFTTKAPAHVIEAIDAISTFMEIPRNTLMNVLINQFLMHSLNNFSLGYHSQDFPSKSPANNLLDDMEKILSLSPEISEEAKLFLEQSLNDFIVMNKISVTPENV